MINLSVAIEWNEDPFCKLLLPLNSAGRFFCEDA